MPTTIQIRRAAAAGWSAATVLADGEIGYETDTGNFKVGDGSTQWSSLVYQFPYSTGSKTSALSATLAVDNANDRVGIGTTTPAETLDVVGNVRMSGITTSSATFNIVSTSTSSQTINVGTGATASSNTKTLNLATGGSAGSTTNINIGSSVAGTTAIAGNATVGGTLGVTGVITGPGTIPIGGIIMWSGSVVPSGWSLCDGSNGTPDLTNKFIIGGSAYSSGAWRESITGSTLSSGGNKDAVVVSHNHTATITDPGHNHRLFSTQSTTGSTSTPQVVGGVSTAVQGAGWNFDFGYTMVGVTDGSSATSGISSTNTTGITASISTNGSSATNANLPPFYSLAFIMRIT